MAKTYNRLNIEINQPINDIMTAVKDDTFSRFLDVFLFSNGTSIDLTDHKVRIYIKKPDGKEIYNQGTITDAPLGRVQFELTNQTLAVCGQLQCQIIIYNNEETQILSTEIFKIMVTKSLICEEAIESTNEYGALVVLFQNIYEARMQIKEILDKIGNPGVKGEELNKKTLFEQLEWLIDFSQKNSVGSLGDKIDSINLNIQKEMNILPLLAGANIDKTTKTLNESSGNVVLLQTSGSGNLVFCVLEFRGKFTTTSGFIHYKVYIDNKILLNLKLNPKGASIETSDVAGIINTNLPFNHLTSNIYPHFETATSNSTTLFRISRTALKVLPFQFNSSVINGKITNFGNALQTIANAIVTNEFIKFNSNLRVEFQYSGIDTSGAGTIALSYCYI